MQTLIQKEREKKKFLVTMEYVISIIFIMRIFLIDPRAILFGKSFNDDDETAEEKTTEWSVRVLIKKRAKQFSKNYS